MGLRQTFKEIDYFFSYRTTRGVKWLIYSNTIVFLIQFLILPLFRARYLFFDLFAVSFQNTVGHLFIWQLFTYMFIHFNGVHILFNMFALWMFGTQLERYWGTKKFLKYYFITGIGAGIFHLIVSLIVGRGSAGYMAGASGAIYGLLLAFAMYYPDSVINLYFILPIKAKHFVIIIGFLTFFSSISGSDNDIAYFTHLGGLITGYLYLKLPDIWRRQRIKQYRFR